MNTVYDFVINRLSAKAARDTARAASTHRNVAADILGMVEAQAKTGNYELTMSYKSMATVDKTMLDEVLAEFTRCGYQISNDSEGYKISWPMPPEGGTGAPPVPDEPDEDAEDAEKLLADHLELFTKSVQVSAIIRHVVGEKLGKKKVSVHSFTGSQVREGIKRAKSLLGDNAFEVIYDPLHKQLYVEPILKD